MIFKFYFLNYLFYNQFFKKEKLKKIWKKIIFIFYFFFIKEIFYLNLFYAIYQAVKNVWLEKLLIINWFIDSEGHSPVCKKLVIAESWYSLKYFVIGI